MHGHELYIYVYVYVEPYTFYMDRSIETLSSSIPRLNIYIFNMDSQVQVLDETKPYFFKHFKDVMSRHL
jgi:hypothetical protein